MQNEAKSIESIRGTIVWVTTFGEVPLITTPMQPAENTADTPAPPLEKVYECIVNDFNRCLRTSCKRRLL